MSKSLKSITNPIEKVETIKRRLKEKRGGLGYLAAKDAATKIGLTPPR